MSLTDETCDETASSIEDFFEFINVDEKSPALHLGRSTGPVTNKTIEQWNPTLGTLWAMFRKATVGDKDGSYFIRGACTPGLRQNANMLSGGVLLILDGDKTINLETGEIVTTGCIPPSLAHEVLKELGLPHIIYSSHSHAPSKGVNKWRGVIQCPLVDGKELHAMANYVVDAMAKHGAPMVLVGEMLNMSQPWFFPRVRDRQALKEFEAYQYELEEGEEHPFTPEFVKKTTEEWKARGVDIGLPDERGSDRNEDTPIGRFMRQYDRADFIVGLLEEYGECSLVRSDYVNGREAFRLIPPESTSGAAGVHVYSGKADGTWLVHSHNETFQLPDGKKALDAFGVFQWLKHDGDLDAALADAKRMLAIPEVPEYDYTVEYLKPVEYTIDGFMANGTTVIAGAPGVGKTSLLIPLATQVAHLGGENDLRPVLRRKVVYVTEDPGQAERILYGLHKRLNGARASEFRDWFRIIPSKRRSPEELSAAVSMWRKQYGYQAGAELKRYLIEPLFVFDTSNATIDLDNENDNAEVGKAIAAIKESLGTASLWLVAHTSKANSREEVEKLSARGGGAFEGDANATAYIVNDQKLHGKRFMVLGKRRFEALFTELEFTSETAEEEILTPWGVTQREKYRFGIPRRLAACESRRAQKEAADQKLKDEADQKLKRSIIDALRGVYPEGLNSRNLRERVTGKNEAIDDAIADLISTEDIYIVIGEKNAKVHKVADKHMSLEVDVEDFE